MMAGRLASQMLIAQRRAPKRKAVLDGWTIKLIYGGRDDFSEGPLYGFRSHAGLSRSHRMHRRPMERHRLSGNFARRRVRGARSPTPDRLPRGRERTPMARRSRAEPATSAQRRASRRSRLRSSPALWRVVSVCTP